MFTEIDTQLRAAEFNQRIYAGEILRFSGLSSVDQLVRFAQKFCELDLYPQHPTLVHDGLSIEELVPRLRKLRTRFMCDEQVRDLWRHVFQSIGLEDTKIANDRFILRFQIHQSGDVSKRSKLSVVAPIPAHRDTWGSNIYAQVNWWAPVYPLSPGNTMAIYPSMWNTALKNSSRDFDLPAVVAKNAESGFTKLKAEDATPVLQQNIDQDLGLPVLIKPGEIIAFSGAHLHRSIPNLSELTRVSLDTRTVMIEDIMANRGAPNIDGLAPFMAPNWFARMSDRKNVADIMGVQAYCPLITQG